VSYVTWDCETTTKVYNKRKASPFHPDNFVVASGWARADGEVVGEYFGSGPKPTDWFSKLLVGTTLLVGQNIKFDLLYALREPHNLAAWQDFVARGGNVFDVQLAEYLLRGMEPTSHMLSMDEMVPAYGGNVKIDEVKSLWQAGVDTVDIDRDLLMRYLCGDESGLGDIGNTRKIFLGQLAKARKTGQVKSLLLNMGSLLCTIEMERAGMFVNKELGLKIAAELKTKLDATTKELEAYLPEDLPFDFNWSNRYHLSPLIFGGKVKYAKRVPTLNEDGTQAYAQKEEKHVVLKEVASVNVVDGKREVTYKTMTVEDYNRLAHQPEAHRFLSGKNAGEYKTKNIKGDDLTKPKSAMRDFFYEFPRLVEPRKEWESSTEGLYSVSAEVMESLTDMVNIANG
jgi:hypothetical protein